MPKRITILDPHGAEVAHLKEGARWSWIWVVRATSEALTSSLEEDPKLGTYTVTVKEISDD